MEKINEKQIRPISKIAYPALLFIAAVNIFLIALAPEAVAIFAPPEYYDAIWIMPPVAMSSFFTFSYFLFSEFEFYYQKTKMIALATSAGAVLNIILNFIFIRIFGYYAAGYTTLFCYIVYAAFHFLFMRKICREYLDNQQPYSVRKYLAIVGIFLTVGFAFLLTYTHPILRYGLLAVLIIVCIAFRKKIIAEAKNILSVKGKRG